MFVEVAKSGVRGEIIKSERNKRGWSQNELGRRSGLTGATIGNYEEDERDPKVKDLLRIAKALGITYTLLIDEEIEEDESDSGERNIQGRGQKMTDKEIELLERELQLIREQRELYRQKRNSEER